MRGSACSKKRSLSLRRILDEQKLLVYVRIVVGSTIFDFMTEEDWGG